ncbi:MAG: hypothetical protein QM755_04245 [Luteolibacter sp.]
MMLLTISSLLAVSELLRQKEGYKPQEAAKTMRWFATALAVITLLMHGYALLSRPISRLNGYSFFQGSVVPVKEDGSPVRFEYHRWGWWGMWHLASYPAKPRAGAGFTYYDSSDRSTCEVPAAVDPSHPDQEDPREYDIDNRGHHERQ